MNIGFDAKRLYNNFTGLGNYSRTLVSNLNRYYPEDTYTLYTPDIQRSPETDVFLQEPAFKTVTPRGPFKSLWRTCSIKKNLKRDHLDIYHGLSHEIPVGIQHTNTRSVVTIHDIIYKTYPEMFSPIDRKIYDLKFRYACKHADKIIAISECTKKDIITYFDTPEEKITVVYQAINPIYYQMQSPESAQEHLKSYAIPRDYLLYVGSINSRKNLLSIVQALALLPTTLDIPLVIIGNGGTYKEKVIQYAGEKRLTHRLIWLNNVNDTRTLQAFYQQAKIFIFPSFYEGFGLPVTEALLCKTPVITSAISSLPEAGGEHTRYVQPTDVEAIAHAIAQVLTDSDQRARMMEQGFAFAHQQFNVRELTRQVNDIYRQLALPR